VGLLSATALVADYVRLCEDGSATLRLRDTRYSCARCAPPSPAAPCRADRPIAVYGYDSAVDGYPSAMRPDYVRQVMAKTTYGQRVSGFLPPKMHQWRRRQASPDSE
jgi:hypothetical protein